MKKRREEKANIYCLAVSGLTMLILICAALFLTAGRALMLPPPDSADYPKEIKIETGTKSAQIAKQLEARGIVKNARVMRYLILATKSASDLKAGTYKFAEPQNLLDVLKKLKSGRVELAEITIPEGLTLEETADAIASAEICDKEKLLEEFRKTMSPFGVGSATLEGYLFPNTYKFSPRESEKKITETLLNEFKRNFKTEWFGRAEELNFTPSEIIVLASLIEKETAYDDERPLISAVFHNRLRKRIPLQCDPTVIYAMKLEGLYAGVLLTKHLRDTDSPYNTYKYAGLPPGPICSPGRASVESALYPASAPYLYFVARADGRHQFSATLAEHNRAVAEYRRYLRQTDKEKK